MATVFISCGQRGSERKIAEKIASLLTKHFSLSAYLAFKVQSLDDIMIITKKLRSSDYYLFIDFRRRRRHIHPEDLSVSLFTHQELALAYNVGFTDMIALCQKGSGREGFINYILSNPEIFTSEKNLYAKVKKLVKEKGWSKKFSRNLALSNVEFSGWIPFQDHIGGFWENVYKISVRNKRPDMAAVRTLCSLNHIVLPDGSKLESPDKNYLKWAWQIGFSKTILPQDEGTIDLFAIRHAEPGIFLHSQKDFVRLPVVKENGTYEFCYTLFAEGFPITHFKIAINLNWIPNPSNNTKDWLCKTTAKLKEVVF